MENFGKHIAQTLIIPSLKVPLIKANFARPTSKKKNTFYDVN